MLQLSLIRLNLRNMWQTLHGKQKFAMNRSTQGLPVHHQLPEFTETHVHQVSDAIQPSHPLSSVTGCGVIWQSNGSLLMAVLMLLCSIRIRWVQCALILLTDSFPTSDFYFTGLFNVYTSLFSLYSQAWQSAVLIYIPLQQLPDDCMCHIYYS